MQLSVKNSVAFVQDPHVKAALASSVASVAGVQQRQVVVELSLLRRRRLSAAAGSRTETVWVSYVILLGDVEEAPALTDALQSVSSDAVASVLQQQLRDVGLGETYGTVEVASFSASQLSASTPTTGLDATTQQEETSLGTLAAVLVGLLLWLLLCGCAVGVCLLKRSQRCMSGKRPALHTMEIDLDGLNPGAQLRQTRQVRFHEAGADSEVAVEEWEVSPRPSPRQSPRGESRRRRAAAAAASSAVSVERYMREAGIEDVRHLGPLAPLAQLAHLAEPPKLPEEMLPEVEEEDDSSDEEAESLEGSDLRRPDPGLPAEPASDLRQPDHGRGDWDDIAGLRVHTEAAFGAMLCQEGREAKDMEKPMKARTDLPAEPADGARARPSGASSRPYHGSASSPPLDDSVSGGRKRAAHADRAHISARTREMNASGIGTVKAADAGPAGSKELPSRRENFSSAGDDGFRWEWEISSTKALHVPGLGNFSCDPTAMPTNRSPGLRGSARGVAGARHAP